MIYLKHEAEARARPSARAGLGKGLYRTSS